MSRHRSDPSKPRLEVLIIARKVYEADVDLLRRDFAGDGEDAAIIKAAWAKDARRPYFTLVEVDGFTEATVLPRRGR